MTLAGSMVLVIWEWEWFSEEFESSSDERTDVTVIPETPPPEREISDDAISEALVSPSIHTAMFNCIGCTREVEYHVFHNFAPWEKLWNQTYARTWQPIWLHNTIAFVCRVDEKWQKIGYAIKEVLGDLHNAIESNTIIDVSIEWIKYKYVIYWQTLGWYAGINITRKGEWSNTFLHSQSIRM